MCAGSRMGGKAAERPRWTDHSGWPGRIGVGRARRERRRGVVGREARDQAGTRIRIRDLLCTLRGLEFRESSVNEVKKISRKNSSRSHPHPRRRWPSLSRHTSRGPAHAGASRPTLTSLQPGVLVVAGGALMARRRSPDAARSVVRRRCTVRVDTAPDRDGRPE